MRIVFISDNYPPETNAVAARVHERCALWAREHDVEVITCWPNFPRGRVYEGYRNRPVGHESVDGVRVTRVATIIAANKGVVLRLIDFISFMATGLLASVWIRRPDVFVAASPQFFAGIAGVAAASLRRVPFVLELGDVWPAQVVAVGAMKPGLGIWIAERVELWMYGKASHIIALTEGIKENICSRGIRLEKVTVVRNGTDLQRFFPREPDTELAESLGITPGQTVVGYIGTHGMSQGLQNVIEAAELLRTDDRIKFVFVGEGAEKESLKRSVSLLGLENVVFVDQQPKDQMSRYWSVCTAALVHLRDDPLFAGALPSKIVEAMAMGVPLIYCGPVGEASDLIASTQTGVIVEPEDSCKLATCISSLATSPELIAELSGNCVAESRHHSREAQASAVLEILLKAGG